MGVSLFLAKLLGLYLLIVGGLCLLRKETFIAMAKELFASKAMLALSGAMSLCIGLAIAIGHPVYTFDWRGLITLFGYLAIAKGIMRIWFPDVLRAFALKVLRDYFTGFLLVIFVLGCILTYAGFTSA
jgi:hypothetical protein